MKLKYFTKEHEWAVVDKKGQLRVGITDYAVESIGDVTLVELEPVGTVLAANERFGDVESVKAVSELFSPVSGEILEVNNDLENEPELINDSPNVKGWMILIKMSDPSELDNLMFEEEYNAYIADL